MFSLFRQLLRTLSKDFLLRLVLRYFIIKRKLERTKIMILFKLFKGPFVKVDELIKKIQEAEYHEGNLT